MASAVRAFIAAHRANRYLERLAKLSWQHLRAYRNFDYEPRTNGEFRVLEAMGRLEPRCIFDVGANVGNWTTHATAVAPSASIHCFEIVPSVAAELTLRFVNHPSVRVNSVGLADRPGTVEVMFYPDTPELSTMLDIPLSFAADAAKEVVEAAVTTGDAYCRDNGIEEIDLLKIDTEGKEFDVLGGFSELLGAGCVRMVQFEYGYGSVYTKDLLRDFHEYFAARGYVVGKVFPRSVDFRPYSVTDEDFIGPNYVAIRDDDRTLARILGEV